MSLLAGCLAVGLLASAAPPRLEVKALETQKVGETTYFRLTLTAPAGLAIPRARADEGSAEREVRRRGQLPRLLPLDRNTRAVYLAGLLEGEVKTLTFLGQRTGDANPRFRLLYPVQPPPRKGLAALLEDADLQTIEVEADWAKAKRLPARDQYGLQRDYARALAQHLAGLHMQGSATGFPAVAHELALRKYALGRLDLDPGRTVPSGSLLNDLLGAGNGGVFELTTGATALTESLALRLAALPAGGRKKEARTIPIADIPGIDIAEHPWKKMMAGKKPAAEPLACLVPHDNSYFTVHDPFAFVSAWEVLDTWGGSVLRSPRLLDRDHGLRGRYERQLCLPAAELAGALPARTVTALALTGSDLFWLEGSDLTVLFEVSDPAAFRKAHSTFIARARKAHGAALTEQTEKYRDHAIESFVTPRREVSLYRTSLGKVVVCSNSPVAIRQILDVSAGKRKALAESLDFQYMRTVFRRDAKQEDGFAFLSDPFVRRLVGPATRIKEARRQEARSALQLAGAAALFTALETGALPRTTKALLEGADLDADQLSVPEGKPVTWDSAQGQAVSEVYNTLEFSTPLIELPLDDVTASERRDYRRFREEYLRLWRRYFDPVGIRYRLGPGPASVEVYLLPLVNNSAYNDLRQTAGGGTVNYSPSRIPPGTLFRYLTRLPLENGFMARTGIGAWGLVRADDRDLDLPAVLDYELRREMGLKVPERDWQLMPLVLGAEILDVKALSLVAQYIWESQLKPRGKKIKEDKYHGVVVKEAPIRKDSILPEFETLYQASVDNGYYLSWSRKALERWIDVSLAQEKVRARDIVEANVSLYVAPPSGKNAEAVSTLLEWETHKRALGAAAAWQGLYEAGLVSPRMSTEESAAAARRVLGYVPCSPDGTAFAFEEKVAQVSNKRHGSPARPVFQARLAPGSQVLALFSQVRSVRADLRFREDGVHTTLTLDWAAARK